MSGFTAAMNNAKSFIDTMDAQRITKQNDSYIEGLLNSIIDCGGRLTKFEPDNGLIYRSILLTFSVPNGSIRTAASLIGQRNT